MYRPSRRVFQELSRLGKRIPLARVLPLESCPEDLFEALSFQGPRVLLDSARTHPVTGRYSFIVGEPNAHLTAKGNRVTLESQKGTESFEGDPLAVLQQLLEARRALRLPGFPPFVGGAVGFLGFDAYRYFEPPPKDKAGPPGSMADLPPGAVDDLHLPDVGFLLCDQAIVIDHLLEKLWVIVLADPAAAPQRAYEEAIDRIDILTARLRRSPHRHFEAEGREISSCKARSLVPLRGTRDDVRQVRSTHSQASFETMVRKAKEFIAQGEIYQANLSQRFALPRGQDPWVMYRRLKAINPSPFAAFADFGGFQIVSGSPERFLRVKNGIVETRPIAGTRPKGRTAVETARLRQELILSEKERAEHLMLVDLERNDLGRVCRYGTVRVDELMVLEEYSHVIHIVSNVRGRLSSAATLPQLLAATFPGGTITGCPKIRSIEIIDALEPVRRQLYTGSLGYVSATGDLDFNLLIRTAIVMGETVYVQTGAGIVADSDPVKEFEETVHKAQALLETLHADPTTSSGQAQNEWIRSASVT